MSVAMPMMDERFTIVTQKYHTANPGEKWVNTWEVVHDGSSDYAGLMACKDAICAFEMEMASGDIYLEKSRVSTFVAEAGYDPQSFVTSDENLTGKIAFSSDALPLSATLFIRRQVQWGRQGKLFLRGALQESDVEATAGEWSLTDQTGLNSGVQTILTSTGLIGYINATGVPPAFCLCLAAGDATFPGASTPTTMRTIIGLEISGVAWNKMSRAPKRIIP